MINQLGKLLLSFMVTGWIYSECVLLYPPIEAIGNRFVKVFSIPTHDKWPAIADSPEAKKLGGDLESILNKSVGKRYALFGPRVKELWNGKKQVARADLVEQQESVTGGKKQAATGERSGWSQFSGNRSSISFAPSLGSF